MDKLNQALGLVLQVVQEQAELGKKAVDFSQFPVTKESIKALIKAGRTLSGDNEERLQKACDHMGQAMDHVKDVIESAHKADDGENENEDGEGEDDNDATIPEPQDQNPQDEGKSTHSGLLKKLLDQANSQHDRTENQLLI
jgi:hypothetical protein